MLIIFWSTAAADASAVAPPSRPLFWHTPDPRRLRLLYYSLQHFYELWSAFPLLGAHHILMCRITRQHLWFFLFFKLFSGDLQFVILAGNLIGRLRYLLLPTWQLKTLLAQGLNAFAFAFAIAFAFALTLELSLCTIAPGTVGGTVWLRG